jgi:hypothetical protein
MHFVLPMIHSATATSAILSTGRHAAGEHAVAAV